MSNAVFWNVIIVSYISAKVSLLWRFTLKWLKSQIPLFLWGSSIDLPKISVSLLGLLHSHDHLWFIVPG